MKYWMEFHNNKQIILSLSTTSFRGDVLDIDKLKERFNNNLLRNKEVVMCKITFLGNGVNKTFIAGYRNGKCVIVDTETKKEYSIQEYKKELDVLQNILEHEQLLLNH